MCVCACVRESKRKRWRLKYCVCVCVWVREKEREKDRDGKRMQNFHLVEFCLGKGNFIFKWLSTKVSLKDKKICFLLISLNVFSLEIFRVSFLNVLRFRSQSKRRRKKVWVFAINYLCRVSALLLSAPDICASKWIICFNEKMKSELFYITT